MSHFANLVGNASAFAQLSNLIDRKLFPNSVMLRGPRGVGKFTAALQFARLANCEGTKTLRCTCESCRKFESRVSPNCLSYPTKVSKNVLRDLQQRIGTRISGGHRFILLRVENIDITTQDMFLKVLEEPTDRTSFIITSAMSLPKRPIVSRSVTVQFSPCSQDDLVAFCIGNPQALRMFKEFTDSESEMLLILSGGSPGSLFGLMSDAIIRTKLGLLRLFFDRVSRPEFFRQLAGVDDNSMGRCVRLVATSVLQGHKGLSVTKTEADHIITELSKRSVCPLKWRLTQLYMELRA